MRIWRSLPSSNSKVGHRGRPICHALRSRGLSLFRHIVEAGSITHGAERANLALAAASRASATWNALGADLLVRGRQGVQPTQAGRTLLQHARTILAAGRAAARGSRRLCRRARRPDQGAVEHQCAHRIPARGAGLVPGGASACQHRSRGAAERRDRRPDRRGRRRSRHRRRHGRCRRAGNLSVPQATASCWWCRAAIRSRSVRRFAFAQVLDHDFVGLDRASALQRFLADKAARIGQPLRLRVQLRSFDAVCRMVECKVGIGIVPETTAGGSSETMAIATVGLADAWAVRELTICIRRLGSCRPMRASSWSTCAGVAEYPKRELAPGFGVILRRSTPGKSRPTRSTL